MRKIKKEAKRPQMFETILFKKHLDRIGAGEETLTLGLVLGKDAL